MNARPTRVAAVLGACARAGFGPVLLALALAGCTGTEVGNPVAEVQLSLTAHSSDAGVSVAPDRDAGTGIGVDELWVSLGDVRFVLDANCSSDRDTRITLPGPIVAELAHGPLALPVELERAAYCRVRVPLERATDADPSTPAELVGYSTLLRGQREDGVPFEIRSRDKPDFMLRSKDEPFRLDGPNSPLILGFDAAVWLADIDLASLTPDADGEVVIDSEHQTEALRTFEQNLRRSLALFRDLNKDGELEVDEADAPIAQ